MAKIYAKGGGIYSTKETKKMGTNAEKLFEKLLINNGKSYRGATRKEEIIFHFDYIVNDFLEKNFCKIEVKATKAPRRGKRQDPSILFIELKSVGGYPGWVYGKSDYIAFQINSNFILFKRSDLVSYVEKEIINMKLSHVSGKKGTLYTRKNRKDLVAIFDISVVKSFLKYTIL